MYLYNVYIYGGEFILNVKVVAWTSTFCPLGKNHHHQGQTNLRVLHQSRVGRSWRHELCTTESGPIGSRVTFRRLNRHFDMTVESGAGGLSLRGSVAFPTDPRKPNEDVSCALISDSVVRMVGWVGLYDDWLHVNRTDNVTDWMHWYITFPLSLHWFFGMALLLTLTQPP